MAKYRINSRGANHTRLEKGEYRRYGKGDVIELPEESVAAGIYDHLKLVKVSGDVATTSTPAAQVNDSTLNTLTEDQKKLIEDEAAAAKLKADKAQELIALAEAATTAKDIKEIGDKAVEAGVLASAPAKKSELIDALADVVEAAAGN